MLALLLHTMPRVQNFIEQNLMRMVKESISTTNMMLMAIKFIENVEMLIRVT